MKKVLILFSLIISGFYLSQAINLNLGSGDKLSGSNWNNISNITSKINLSSNDLNISGKLVSSGKICAGNTCLGECSDGQLWDNDTNNCVDIGTTQETAGETCESILIEKPTSVSGYYFIKPVGYIGDAFEVYCDMTNQGGGWTLVGRHKDGLTPSIIENVREDTFGLMQDDKWISLRNSMTTGMIFIDENNKLSMLLKSVLETGACRNINQVSTLNINGEVYHDEITGCTTSGGDYTFFRITSNSSKGTQLQNYSNKKFSIYPYNLSSDDEQNQMKYYKNKRLIL